MLYQIDRLGSIQACRTYLMTQSITWTVHDDGRLIIAESPLPHNRRQHQYGRGQRSYRVSGVNLWNARRTASDDRPLRSSSCNKNPSKVNVQLKSPLPLAVDDVVVEPDWTGKKINVFREIVIDPESAAPDKVLPAGVVGGEHPLVVLVAFFVLDRPEPIVVADQSAAVVQFAAGSWEAGEHRIGRRRLTSPLTHESRVGIAVIPARVDSAERPQCFAHDEIHDVHVGNLRLGPDVENAYIEGREPASEKRAFGRAEFGIKKQRIADRFECGTGACTWEQPVNADFEVEFFEGQDPDRQADIRGKGAELASCRLTSLFCCTVQAKIAVIGDVPDVERLDVRGSRRPIGRGGGRKDRSFHEERQEHNGNDDESKSFHGCAASLVDSASVTDFLVTATPSSYLHSIV